MITLMNLIQAMLIYYITSTLLLTVCLAAVIKWTSGTLYAEGEISADLYGDAPYMVVYIGMCMYTASIPFRRFEVLYMFISKYRNIAKAKN